MQGGLAVLGIELDPGAAFPADSIGELVTRNVGPGEGRLRLLVTRGVDSGNHLPDAGAQPTVLATVDRLAPDTPLSDPRPLELATVVSGAPRPGPWSSLKSLSHLAYVLAAAEARRRGAEDGLLRVGDQVLETTAANLFVVHGERLATPPHDAGILAGVTRAVVVELATAAGLPVEERPVGVSELAQADEMLASGSIAGVRAVGAIDERPLPRPLPGPVTRRLQAALAALVTEECR
jgi:branched-subunit amino acid aminotransferase/4-amino-4-deoxychorismate lyase